ncbi:hypothetical protein ACJX0J_017898, partial [Zea mays]
FVKEQYQILMQDGLGHMNKFYLTLHLLGMGDGDPGDKQWANDTRSNGHKDFGRRGWARKRRSEYWAGLLKWANLMTGFHGYEYLVKKNNDALYVRILAIIKHIDIGHKIIIFFLNVLNL